MQTGVTPLPDNDSRDTYCYEIHVHTGFTRGAGTSAEVSIVLTGGLGDSEPRVLKDSKRKNFKTGLLSGRNETKKIKQKQFVQTERVSQI